MCLLTCWWSKLLLHIIKTNIKYLSPLNSNPVITTKGNLNKLQHIDDRCRDFYSRSVVLDEHSLRSFLRNINHDSIMQEGRESYRKEGKWHMLFITNILSQGLISGEAEQSNYEKEFLQILYTSGKNECIYQTFVFGILCLFYFDGIKD